ncbi:MAG: ATP-binding protein [Candidatus Auribacterota bacterium]|nr:ATP-binding protein [Candidatus Auribacterota bacterium]
MDNGIPTKEEFVDQLAAAFSYFNANTEKLTNAYNKLEQEVARINAELEKKNNQLQQKITEIDHVRSHFENILHSMGTAVIAIDLNEKITVINRCAEELLGIDSSACAGRPFGQLVTLDKITSTGLSALLKSDQPLFEREAALLCKNGDSIAVGVSMSLIRNSKDDTIGYLLLLRDLREIKKLQAKARRADRLVALGEMAARVAHEIRNPLGGIEGFASLLVRILESDKENQRMAAYIMEGVKSVNHIVSSLLDYARPVHIKKSFFPIREIIYDVARMIETSPNIDKKNIKIIAEFNGDNDPVMYADRVLTQQIIWNLLVNSIQAMDHPGDVVISCGKRGPLKHAVEDSTLLYHENSFVHDDSMYFYGFGEATWNTGEIHFWNVLSVTDQGTGIDPQIKDKIFYPFYTTRENGTGLGLSTVYKIIEEHGGKISVKSQAGRGACITLYFPGEVPVQEEVSR